MENIQTSAKQVVPMGDKIAFGIGMLANQMFPAVLGIFMVVLIQDLGFPTWMWGVLFFLPRVFDSVTDPIMGFISDNTKSKWGRRRQYVFIGALIMGLSFVIMWQLYRENGVSYNFYFFLIFSILFYLGLTIFSVPYVAMGYEMSSDFHERTNIMAIAQFIGQFAWVIAPWFWVIMYDTSLFESADVATRTLAIGVGIVCTLFAITPAVFLKQKSTLHEQFEPLTLASIGSSLAKILKGFVEAFRIAPFRKLCIATFLIFNAFNTIASFSFFIVVYYLFNGDTEAAWIWPTLFGSIGAVATSFIVIPIVAKMSSVVGKKNAFIYSQLISIVGYVLLWFLFVPGKPWMFIFALPFFSFGIGSLFTLMMSMTADVIDMDELNTGKRREGIFGAIYWWMVKFGFAIAGLLSGYIMTLVGFTPGAETQPEGAVTGLRLFYSGLPILGTLVAIFVMHTYSVTEEKSNEIRAILDARAKAAKDENPYKREAKTFVPGNAVIGQEAVTDYSSFDEVQYPQVFQTVLREGITGICFSPYEEGQNEGDQLQREQIVRRMKIVQPYVQWIRSFSCSDGNEWIPEVAKEQGLKTMVGAWISSDRERNKRELIKLAQLARKGFVDIAVIGNETLLREEVSEEEILQYLQDFKSEFPNIRVSYVDAYYQFVNRPKLVQQCDVLLINCYPFWEGTTIAHAQAHLASMHQSVVNIANGKEVIITETGWPNKGNAEREAVPSEQNAMRYFIDTYRWANHQNIACIYFSSFDESWKIRHEGDVGARWGIWDKHEKQKYK